MIRAKFKCVEIRKYEGVEQPVLRPVYGDGEENKAFSAATPSGELNMWITNQAAFGKFVIGKSYYIDVTEAPA